MGETLTERKTPRSDLRCFLSEGSVERHRPDDAGEEGGAATYEKGGHEKTSLIELLT